MGGGNNINDGSSLSKSFMTSIQQKQKDLETEDEMKKKLLEQQRIRMLRMRSGSLLDSATETGSSTLGG